MRLMKSTKLSFAIEAQPVRGAQLLPILIERLCKSVGNNSVETLRAVARCLVDVVLVATGNTYRDLSTGFERSNMSIQSGSPRLRAISKGELPRSFRAAGSAPRWSK